MNQEEQFTALEKAAIKWLEETDTMQFSQMELLTMFAAHSETRTILQSYISDEEIEDLPIYATTKDGRSLMLTNKKNLFILSLDGEEWVPFK